MSLFDWSVVTAAFNGMAEQDLATLGRKLQYAMERKAEQDYARDHCQFEDDRVVAEQTPGQKRLDDSVVSVQTPSLPAPQKLLPSP